MTDLEKAEILYECQMFIIGNGQFDLDIEDAVEVLRILRTKKTPESLREALEAFYNKHPRRMETDESFREHYEEY